MSFIQHVDARQTRRIGLPRAYSGSSARSFRRPFRCLGVLRAQLRQPAQPHEVVGGHVQRQQLVHLVQSSHHHVTQLADGLGPAKALLDALSHPHADLVANVARGALVDGAATETVGVLCDVRRDLEFPARLDEAFAVVGLGLVLVSLFADVRSIERPARWVFQRPANVHGAAHRSSVGKRAECDEGGNEPHRIRESLSHLALRVHTSVGPTQIVIVTVGRVCEHTIGQLLILLLCNLSAALFFLRTCQQPS